MNWIGDSTAPTSAGKPLKIEAKIPLAHTQSLISWSRCSRTALGLRTERPWRELEGPTRGVTNDCQAKIRVVEWRNTATDRRRKIKILFSGG